MKRFIQQLRKDERGLTLVELLAVIVILGIIATIAFVSIGNVIENSKKDAHVANAMQLIASAKLAEASQGWPEGENSGYTTAATPTAPLVALDTIEKLTHPWDSAADATYIGTVTKVEEPANSGTYVYKVKIDGGADSKIPSEIEIDGLAESVINQGRDAVEAAE